MSWTLVAQIAFLLLVLGFVAGTVAEVWKKKR